MIFESKTRTICPVINLEVILTELYDAEGGGSCQADVSLISRTCSHTSDCGKASHDISCLLIEDLANLNTFK